MLWREATGSSRRSHFSVKKNRGERVLPAFPQMTSLHRALGRDNRIVLDAAATAMFAACFELQSSPRGTLVQWHPREAPGIRGRVCAAFEMNFSATPMQREWRSSAPDTGDCCQEVDLWLPHYEKAPACRQKDGTGKSAFICAVVIFSKPLHWTVPFIPSPGIICGNSCLVTPCRREAAKAGRDLHPSRAEMTFWLETFVSSTVYNKSTNALECQLRSSPCKINLVSLLL